MKIYLYTLVIIAPILLIFSCQKESDSNTTSGDINVNLNVSIEEYKSLDKIASSSVEVKQNDSNEIQNVNNELDAIVTLEKQEKKDKIINKFAATKISQPVKLTLVIYNHDKSQILVNKEVTVGVNPNIGLTGGQVYHWYAVSTNETNFTPVVNASGDITPESIENKDFLFDKGTLNTAVVGANYLNITFKRLISKVAVHVETRGLFGGIEDDSKFELGELVGGNFQSLIYTAKFNILTEAFTNERPVAPVLGSKMELTEGLYHANLENLTTAQVSAAPTSKAFFGNESKTAYFYTIKQKTIAANTNTLRLRLNLLKIKLDDNTIRTFATNTLTAIPSAVNIPFNRGNFIKAKVNLIESGINMGSYYSEVTKTIVSNTWARTNLRYNGSKIDALRFRPDNNYATPEYNTEYFINSVNPMVYDVGITKNVCRSVYPYNTWINAEPYAFGSLGNVFTSTHIEINGVPQHAVIFNPTSVVNNSAYPDNNLKLPFFGIRIGVTNSFKNHGKDTPVNISSTIGTKNAKLYYLSSYANTVYPHDFVVNKLDMTQNNSSRSFIKTSVTDVNNVSYTEFAEAGNGYPVRCIRRPI